MKKFLKFASILALLVVMAFSFTACSFVNTTPNNGGSTTNNNTNNGNGGSNAIGSEVSAGYTGGASGGLDLKLENENTFFKNAVSFNTDSESDLNRKILTVKEAGKKVDGSAVAIQVTTANGSVGSGAGVIVDMSINDKDGEPLFDEKSIYIITCHHVIGSTGSIVVYIRDENDDYTDDDYAFSGVIGGNVADNLSNYAVTLIGGDVKSDLALLKLDLSKPAVSGNVLSLDKIVKAKVAPLTYNVEKFDEVFSIGNPTGVLPGWASGTGIISKLCVETSVENVGTMSLMGISIPSNPGNSGGGLFNMYGELIGITNAGNTNYEEINFAIPLYTRHKNSAEYIDNGIVNVISSLAKTYSGTNYGFVAGRKAAFGFTVSTQTALTGDEVVYIAGVNKDSLAEKAGLLKGDVITAVKLNGQDKEFKTYNEFTDILSKMKIDDEIELSVMRNVTHYKKDRTGGYLKDFFGNLIIDRTETTTPTIQKLKVAQYIFCNTGK